MTILEALQEVVESIKEWTNDQLNNKVNKEDGKMLSSNDYTTNDKNKVSAIGDLSTLETASKTDLVSAINEVVKSSSSDSVQNGSDGFSPTATVEQTDTGAVITITDKDGTTTATVTNGKDGVDGAKGDKGDPGEDYVLTDADKTEIAAKVPLVKVAEQPTFVNDVSECTDTSKVYVLPDGFIYAYLPFSGSSYTNLAGTISYDKRLSSSGKISSTAMTGAAVTDFIAVKEGDIVRVKGLNIKDDLTDSAYPYFCFYTGASESNVTATAPTYVVPSQHGENTFPGFDNTPSGGVCSWTAFARGYDESAKSLVQHDAASSLTHIRISGKYTAGTEIIVTVNEEITENTGNGYAWQNTGHAFVPADYEERIIALEEDAAARQRGNILCGKKWVSCGDSFTANGYNASDGFDESVYIYQDGRFAGKNIVYPYIIGLRNNMDIVNLASGGQTMAASSNSFMSVYQNIPADADYITIMLGINDKVQGLPVGTLEDSTDSTFCGAYNIAMEYILENHPFAHIGIMVSHGTNAEIMEATRDIAERWGVPCLDYGSPQVPLMNRYTGRNVCARAQEIREKNFCVISDGTTATNGHPNTAAHEYESTFIEAWLRTL